VLVERDDEVFDEAGPLFLHLVTSWDFVSCSEGGGVGGLGTRTVAEVGSGAGMTGFSSE
jgi:hypothetical protein